MLDRNRERVFFIYLGVIGLLLVIGLIRADVQQSEAVEQTQMYSQCMTYMENGQFQEALPILKMLYPQQPDSWEITWYYGVTLDETGNQKDALRYIARAGLLRPALFSEPGYTVSYGRALYENRQYDLAEKFLLLARKGGGSPEIQQIIDDLLREIDLKTTSGAGDKP